jgi:uncharacterized membrane protein HdeD (DUF308 family)
MVIGVLVLLVGLVWIAQGTNLMHGSGMSGHGEWTVIGIVLVVIGAALLVDARRTAIRRSK